MRTPRNHRSVAWLLCLIGTTLLLSTASARAAIWNVPGDYPTIQAAVDAAASGDEIILATGTFEEQVVITKNLIVSGAGAELTELRAPVAMPHTAHALQYNAVIHVEQPGVTVTIRDLTIDGRGRGKPGRRFTGIMFDRTHGSVERVEIRNIHEDPVSMAVTGIGIYVYSASADAGDVVLEDVTVHDVQKAGVVCAGGGTFHTLRRVEVIRGDIQTDAVLNGIEMQLGARGLLTDCLVKGVYYDGTPDPQHVSVGYLPYFSGSIVLENCRSLTNQAGLYVISSDVTIRGGELTSYPTSLVYNYGVVATSGVGKSAAGGLLGVPVPTEEGGGRGDRAYVDLVLEDLTVAGNLLPESQGLIVQSPFEDLAVTVTGCTITGWAYGASFGEFNGGEVLARVDASRIAGNQYVGVESNTVIPCDARGNDWGDPTGPHHPDTNPGGLGDVVSDNVLFDPWLTGNVICSPLPQTIAQDDWTGTEYADTVTLRYLGGGSDLLYGYSIDVLWDESLVTATGLDVSRPTTGPFADAALFLVYPVAGGLRVDAALGGLQPGIAAGPLCEVRFTLVGEPDYTEIPVTVVVNDARNQDNESLTGFAPNDGLIVGDVQAPVFTQIKLINDTLPHTDLFLKNGDLVHAATDVTDGDPAFGVPYIRGDLLFVLGVEGWRLRPTDYAPPTATWEPRPASATPADGPVTYGVTASDPSGNTSTISAIVTADNTPPLPLQGLTAVPGHQKIVLSWDDPAGLDANLYEIAFRANAWGDYPQYAAPPPAYPAGPGEGVPAVTVAGGTTVEWTGLTDRDVHYLTGLVTDVVLQTATPDPDGSTARATNYWLGDVEPLPGGDGDVDVTDVTVLGTTYGLQDGAPGFDPHCDVGPTFDGSPYGIPTPDDNIGFPDLMIFALNLGVVAPVLDQPAMGEPPQLALRRLDDVTWALELLAPCPGLKGLNVAADLPAGTDCEVIAGELLARQAAPVFLRNIPAHGLDAGLAVLGRGAALAGTGELCRIVLNRPVNGLEPRIQARDLNNTELLAEVTGAAEPGDLPAAFAFAPNHPNPFNPRTTLGFDLPRPEHVRLAIYGLDGSRVRVLLDGRRVAGRHRVVWDGRDARGRACATGTYVAVIEAGDDRAARKMVLMR